jgi:hypothetical protein
VLADVAWSSSPSPGLSERRRTAKGVTALPAFPVLAGGTRAPKRAPAGARRGRPRPMARRPLWPLLSELSSEPAAALGPSLSTEAPGSPVASGAVGPSGSSREPPFRDERVTSEQNSRSGRPRLDSQQACHVARPLHRQDRPQGLEVGTTGKPRAGHQCEARARPRCRRSRCWPVASKT